MSVSGGGKARQGKQMAVHECLRNKETSWEKQGNEEKNGLTQRAEAGKHAMLPRSF